MLRNLTVFAFATALAAPAAAAANPVQGQEPAGHVMPAAPAAAPAKAPEKTEKAEQKTEKKVEKKTKKVKKHEGPPVQKLGFGLRIGPSLDVNDWVSQFKMGFEVDWPLGPGLKLHVPFDMGVGSGSATENLVPGVKYSFRLQAPIDPYVLAGLGFMFRNQGSDIGLALRAGAGAALDLKKGTGVPLKIGPEIDYTIIPVGSGVIGAGTPMIVDVLIVAVYYLPI